MKLESTQIINLAQLHNPIKDSTPTDFGDQQLANRDLVIQMLRWESEFMCSPEGQARYKTPNSGQFTSLDNEYAFNRRVLREFGFTTNAESVANYRRIFRTYFRSATDYDREVINASHYMKNNRCVFYTTPEIQIGDTVPDVPLLTTTPTNNPNQNLRTTLYDAIRDYKLRPSTSNPSTSTQPREWTRLFICAFSNS
jgi:hypothetical protein